MQAGRNQTNLRTKPRCLRRRPNKERRPFGKAGRWRDGDNPTRELQGSRPTPDDHPEPATLGETHRLYYGVRSPSFFSKRPRPVGSAELVIQQCFVFWAGRMSSILRGLGGPGEAGEPPQDRSPDAPGPPRARTSTISGRPNMGVADVYAMPWSACFASPAQTNPRA